MAGLINVHNLIQLDFGVLMYKTKKDLAPDGFYDVELSLSYWGTCTLT